MRVSVTQFTSALKPCRKEQWGYRSHNSPLHSSCAARNNEGIGHTIHLCTQAMPQGTMRVSVTQFTSALKPCRKEQWGYRSHNSPLHSSRAARNKEGIGHTIHLCTQAVPQGTKRVSVTQFTSALKPCRKEQWGYRSHNSPLHSSRAARNNEGIGHTIHLCTQTVQLLQLSNPTPLHSPAISEETGDSTTKNTLVIWPTAGPEACMCLAISSRTLICIQPPTEASSTK